MVLYLFSKDKGNTWSEELAKSGNVNEIWMGKIDNYDVTRDYTASDVTVYRKFNLDGKIIVPSGSTPTPNPTPTPTPTNAQSLFTVDVFNFSNESVSDIQKWCNAVKKQADTDISKWWGYTVDFNFNTLTSNSTKATPGHAYLGLFSNTDQPGDLGWHDVGPNNEPLIKIFTKEAESFSLSPSITISHEIAESISDTNANTIVQGFDESGKACLYFKENCDPVENNTYQVDGVDVSDFVTPAWFIQNANGPYDFLNQVQKPFQMLQGGYMEISYDNGKTWNEVNKNSRHAESHKSEHSRWSLYKKPITKRVKSDFTTTHKKSDDKKEDFNDDTD